MADIEGLMHSKQLQKLNCARRLIFSVHLREMLAADAVNRLG